MGNPINAEKISKQVATVLDNTEFPSLNIFLQRFHIIIKDPKPH